MYQGSYVAIITPMTTDGIDEAALKKMVQWQIASGTHGLVPVGTTGESPTLTEEEHNRVISIVVEEVEGRIPVIAGAGSNNTREALNYNAHASRVGAGATLHVTGYYNRPNQEGIFQHFKALSEESDIPIIVYNIPARCVVDINPDTMARIAELHNVVGVKDATGDLGRPLLEQMKINKPFSYLSGNDDTAVAYNAAGGNGCISVTANVAPELCSQMQQACLLGDFPTAMAIQKKLMPLHKALFLEPSPAGVKYACSLMGMCDARVRLPCVELTNETKKIIKDALTGLELIS